MLLEKPVVFKAIVWKADAGKPVVFKAIVWKADGIFELQSGILEYRVKLP